MAITLVPRVFAICDLRFATEKASGRVSNAVPEKTSQSLDRKLLIANSECASHGGPSEDYGNEEHTTVAAFLPWRGS
jgi:hypothetical protein